MEPSTKSENCNFDTRSKRFFRIDNYNEVEWLKNKSRLRKEDETTHEDVTNLYTATRNQKMHYVN